MTAKKLWIFLLLVALIASGGLILNLTKDDTLSNASDKSESSQTNNSTNTTPNSPKDGEPIVVTGVAICLQPKDTSGLYTLECAAGIKSDNGTSYALKHKDPSVTSSLPTGQRVMVTGSFVPQETKYDMAGVIDVTAIEQL